MWSDGILMVGHTNFDTLASFVYGFLEQQLESRG